MAELPQYITLPNGTKMAANAVPTVTLGSDYGYYDLGAQNGVDHYYKAGNLVDSAAWDQQALDNISKVTLKDNYNGNLGYSDALKGIYNELGGFKGLMDIGKLGLSIFGAINQYSQMKDYMGLLKSQMNQQQANWNEQYNNALKQYNTALADRLRARAAFETGDSTAYNDEITNNSMARGQTGNAGASYLNYQRSAAANNPYNKTTSNTTSGVITQKERKTDEE